MRSGKQPKPRPPLDSGKLNELALSYVGRFATTRAKLKTYLVRKLRERGWDGAAEADLDSITERFAALGYVDDAAFALSKWRSLTSRGYGLRRIEQSLRTAGVEEADGAAARDLARTERVETALHFARRRRIGPFATQPADPKTRQRALSAMVRAGHGFGLARAIVDLAPGAEVDREGLAEGAE